MKELSTKDVQKDKNLNQSNNKTNICNKNKGSDY